MKDWMNPWEFADKAASYKAFAVADFGDEYLAIVAEDNDGTLVTVEDYSDDLVSLIVGQIGNKSEREMMVPTPWYESLSEALDELLRLQQECKREN